jgi:hypothetical protein
MLQADPIARASLDEVLDHPWMKPEFGCPDMPWACAVVPRLAAIRWPDQVDRKTFYRVTALESRNGDEAWNGLDDALRQVSRLCEARSGGDDSQWHSPERTGAPTADKVLRGLREFLRSLVKIRSRAVLDWPTTLIPRSRFAKAPSKASHNFDTKPQKLLVVPPLMSVDKVLVSLDQQFGKDLLAPRLGQY